MSEELQNEEQAQAPVKDEKAADLNINDLNAMRQIIDVASSRGAFKPGSEMIAVGQVYEKLSNFLDQVAKQAEAAKATQGA
jgi:hypothetical protein